MRAARAALLPSDRAILSHYSVPSAMIERGMIGAVMAELSSDGLRWAPEGPSRVFVTPVAVDGRPWSGPTPETPWWETVPFSRLATELIDLVAWRPESPEWWLRTGNATWLGAYPPQFLDHDPVRVHDTPLSWLQSGGRGICALSQEPAERQALLLGIRTIAARDMDHAMALRRLLERPMSIPNIVIEGGDNADDDGTDR